jgi:hypothetical protein
VTDATDVYPLGLSATEIDMVLPPRREIRGGVHIIAPGRPGGPPRRHS